MSRLLMGGLGALLALSAGLFWWQGQAAGEQDRPAIPRAPLAVPEELPEGDPAAVGEAPPMPADVDPVSREQRRFARYDRDRDGIITRIEMMGSRTKAFKALDRDDDNLLSFEEWAVATADRFIVADANRDGRVTPPEFAATVPKTQPRSACKC